MPSLRPTSIVSHCKSAIQLKVQYSRLRHHNVIPLSQAEVMEMTLFGITWVAIAKNHFSLRPMSPYGTDLALVT